LLAAVALAFSAFAASAAELQEPQVFTSSNGLLDIQIVARPGTITTLGSIQPTGWVYDICQRPLDGSLTCPAQSGTPNLYGGTRLALKAGDHLKIRLVNSLPPATDSRHAGDPGEGYLALNPTNIHTHGMLVAPQFPTAANPTYGDNIFVMTLNPANGAIPSGSMIHSDVLSGYTDYDIAVPANHPSGLFWFHPHVHGIALNQISSGLSGIITVGNPTDYLSAPHIDKMNVRHLMLKDIQVLKNGTINPQEKDVVQDQLDPGFCKPAPAAGKPAWQGHCPGDPSADPSYKGGHWFFSVNGQAYPTVKVKSALGEIWRITNASASVGYDLQLWNPTQGRNMLFQVVALDGIALDTKTSTPAAIARATGNRIKAEPCPGASTSPLPVCARTILMMPSSRAEVWVVDRDANDQVVKPTPGDHAIFRTAGVQTGPTGDHWPAVSLGLVDFGSATTTTDAAPSALAVHGQFRSTFDGQRLAADFRRANTSVGTWPDCKPLAKGHSRRIFFNVPVSNPNGFGLGYEELDQNGQPVPGTFQDVAQFDPVNPTICVTLGPNGAPRTERWQIVNLAGEDHNFHIHQTKFTLVSSDGVQNGSVPNGKGVQIDNVPLPHATGGFCNSVTDWRNGLCKTHPVTVDIPFAIAGDFVYHCHILEHEDGGMMARIRVRTQY
jgi:FtsP/CotA-like multicopper oxidase with cupredoxin domain